MSLTFSINLRTMKVSSLHSSQVINCLLSLDDKNCFFIFLLTSLTTFCTFLHLNTNRRLQNEFKTMDASTFFISERSYIKFVFYKKATNNDKIFTVNLTLCSKCQIYSEDLVNFCGLIRKHELDESISNFGVIM